ncbi:hypothetical protein BMF94_4921 [Rhodotorula taiwanensis]|uniref:Ribonuclease T2-like n=1 Tax=Rhodotorula taiwanensis TaxID=741276 RepID=A0A2S5B5S0_9BASI|nr:hypothetical protein BMF94_4921 [Rhodotorula taiwanensis]
MLPLSLFAAPLLVSTVAAEPTQWLSSFLNAAEQQAHTIFGLHACPAPFLLPESCINGASPDFPGLDGCCTNVPGGFLLQTQFWDTAPSTGPNNSWTVHGLWPDRCDGSYDAYCDPSREYTDIRGILQQNAPSLLPFMDTYWKDGNGDDNSFWAHEWNKHGTCISTLNTTCYGRAYKQYEEVVDYYERTIELFKSLPTYDWLAAEGIVPSASQTYTLEQLQTAARKHFGYEAVWGCTGGNKLDEVWYGYHTRGPIAGGKFIPTSPDGSKSSCPDTGIRYLPKYAPSTSTGSGSISNSTSPYGNSTSAFFQGVVNGTEQGCLISAGAWFTSGTCATLHLTPASPSTDLAAGFTMTSSKGPCAVASGALSCAAGNTASTFTLDSNKNLVYQGSSSFTADAVPPANVKETVYTTSDHAVQLTLKCAPQ